MFVNQLILESVYKVPTDVIKTGTKRNRKNKTQSWVNKKDPKDKRKVLIDIDSIPEATRKKYNIPTGKEYFEKKEIENYTATQERIQLEKDLRNSTEKSALYDAYNNDYLPYVSLYKERYSYRLKSNDKDAILYAKQHSFWLKMIEVTGTKHKTFDGGCRRGYNLYMDLKKELVLTRDFNNENYFRILLSRIRKLLKEDKCISDIVANNRLKKKGAYKTSDFHKGLAMSFLSHPNKYCYRVVTDLINYHCIEEKQPQITESWVKRLMVTDNHFRTVAMTSRNGEKYTKDNILAYAVRKGTPFPANVWMIDGSPMQFYCYDENRTRVIRLNLFVVIDVCSRKIVGFDVSFSEDKFNIMNSLQNAVMDEGHLPAEIVSDNFSASKTEEIIALKEKMEKLGTYWRHAKVGNPQDKSYVERFFGSLQSIECALYDDYIGEGIMSHRGNRRNADQLLLTAKRDGLPSLNQMKSRITTLIVTYNQRLKASGQSPKEVYNTLPKPHAIELDSVGTALLFWKRTKATIANAMVKITVNKVQHQFEIYDNKLKMELFKKQVYVRYDEKDLSSIMLFDMINENVICECKPVLKIATALVDRTQEDIDNMNKLDAKKKSHKKYIKDQQQDFIDKALAKTNKKEMLLIHPQSLDKNILKEQEDLALVELYLNRLNVPLGEEEKPNKKPLMSIEMSGEKLDYIDLIEQKKPKKGFKPTPASIAK